MEEAFAPQTYHIATDRERGGNLVVRTTLGGEENHPGAEYLVIWQRIFARTSFQDLAFLPRQTDREWAASGHSRGPSFGCTIAENAESGKCIRRHIYEHRYLVCQWHEERGATSSITKMAMCPAYQRIIAMGEAAIPLILRRLEQEGDEPDMWFWALRILTNADPVPDEARGDTIAMARAWLEWGRAQYAW